MFNYMKNKKKKKKKEAFKTRKIKKPWFTFDYYLLLPNFKILDIFLH